MNLKSLTSNPGFFFVQYPSNSVSILLYLAIEVTVHKANKVLEKPYKVSRKTTVMKASQESFRPETLP